MEKQEAKPQLFTYAHDFEAAKIFSECYALRNIIEADKFDVTELMAKKERVCRFCDKGYPETTFESKAHSIPQLLGNNVLLNDFECDNCNNIFGKYESDLGEYLLTNRTIYGTKGKNGVPKIRKKAKSISNSGNGVISFKDSNMEVTSGEITFDFKKSYTPIWVYKALLKIALTLIDPKDFLYYKYFVRRYMLTTTNDAELGPLAKVGVYEVGRKNKVDNLKCIIYQKKSANNNVPFHAFSLYYENFIFVAPIPLHVYDLSKGFYESMQVKTPPALLFSSPEDGSRADFKQFDFSSILKETKIDKFEINFEEEELRSIIEKKLGTKLPEIFDIESFDIKLDL